MPITKMSDISRRSLIIGGLSAIFLISGFSYAFLLKKKRSENSVYTKGVIVNIDKRLKGGWFANYIFIVENNMHKGSVRYYENFQKINIGDTCYVTYEYGNPNNNNLLRVESDARYYKVMKPCE